MEEINCQGKTSWPELVGKKGEAAANTIEQENENVKATVLKDGTPVILDFRCDRVWVWVNDNGVVVRVPTIG
ncbi:proteinase inhibitor-like [Euphorbia lathyris]|uniref:proteinase inhibitor-like n=1 Tax=Euphorbia lathyris TaxID=212925 RepID=UPI0033139DFE